MTHFRHLSALILTLMAIIAATLTGCHDTDLWDKVPGRQTSFINTYWPLSQIAAVAESSEGAYTIAVKNGPEITFAPDGAWTTINGRGVPLPEQLIFDQLPEPLYRYIRELEMTDAVYTLSRDATAYRAGFLNTSATYTIATAAITQP